VTFVTPERARGNSPVPAQAGSCCCSCCCCCLHTVGGVIGGLVGSVQPVQPTPPVNTTPFPFRRDEWERPPGLHPALLYWGLVCSLSTLLGLYFVVSGKVSTSELQWAVLGVIFFLPLPQLGASVLSLLCVWLLPEAIITDRPAAFVRIGKITLWSFVGAMVGTGLVALLCGLPLMRM
jgi:hypothetical protein